ncbi:MAG: alkaline phosphatase family protein [Candidatus Acidiferrales bacterium]
MMNSKHPWPLRALAMVAVFSVVVSTPAGVWAQHAQTKKELAKLDPELPTDSPIKHLVVIFDENISFDHYFGTYPHAQNPPGETAFHANANTPTVNNLLSAGLLGHNPNSVNPFRLPPADAVTCDQDHNYGDEQKAFDAGLMDKFPESTGTGSTTSSPCNDVGMGTGIVMGYYDGNTVTAIWNYAQYFAMSDNSYSTTFGPSTPGAINLISGNTFGATLEPAANGSKSNPLGNIGNDVDTGAVIGDPRPFFDDCVATIPGLSSKARIMMSGKNIGDLLSTQGITWGWFQGGFRPTSTNAKKQAVCGSTHVGLAGTIVDYVPHHEPFQYYQLTSNPHHLPPTSVSAIGTSDQANHQYDLVDFFAALKAGNLPAVSFLKAAAYQDGHPGNSDPLDEQVWLVSTITKLENSQEWKETAVVILYDDSDGWYDHAMSPIIDQADVSDDNLKAPGSCGVAKPIDLQGDLQNGRCGYGPRQPLLLISPFAKQNFVDHSITDQSSVTRFIEDNWGLPRLGNGSTDARAGSLLNLFDFSQEGTHKVFLDPSTGQVVKTEE